MDYTLPTVSPEEASHGAMEELLNLYIDGELPVGRQADLFAHLAWCETCRCTLDRMMAFRRMSRQEALPVPPAVDDSFFQRLAQLKETRQHVDRSQERRPLWQVRMPVSLRAAALAAILFFVAGSLLPLRSGQPLQLAPRPSSEVQVQPAEGEAETDVIYIFYPGLTIEAPREQEPRRAGAL